MKAVIGPKVADIHAVLLKHWGFHRFRPLQEKVIRSVMSGRDTLALMPTGGGKSLCFQVPAIATGRMCLVISPLIALMKDQVDRLRAQGIAARAVVSGMSHAEIDNALESAALGRLSFLYVSPERLSTDLFKARIERFPLGLIAVDEAHCISQWGYDFRPAYTQIGALRETRPGIPVLALTATATAEVCKDIMAKLNFTGTDLLRASFERPELVFWVSRGEDKHGRLLRILKKTNGSAVIYMRDRRGTLRLARFLKQHGIDADAYHAGMTSKERDRVQKEWTNGNVRCVVATNAFGMGIDKADVRTVVHMDLPPDLESYYQEAGRGGRDGNKAYAFLLTGPGDEERLRQRVAQGFPSLTEVRRVYQAFADMHRIALGSGLMETYPVDLAALAQRTGARQVIVAHALKTLELDGRLALSSGLRSPSRVLIIAEHRVVHRMRVEDVRIGPLLEGLLRLYGGLFEEPALIDEERLARLAGWKVGTVIERLREMDAQRVISYRPRNDLPSATLLQTREDADRLSIDPIALKDRKERAETRMKAMVGYVVNTEKCRARILLDHFDEKTSRDCGDCDVCRERASKPAGRKGDPPEREQGVVLDMIHDIEEMRRDIDDDPSIRGEIDPTP